MKAEPKAAAEVIDLIMARQERDRQNGIETDPKRLVFASGIPRMFQRMIQQRLNELGEPIRPLKHDYALHRAWQDGKTMVLMRGAPATGKTVTCCRWLAPFVRGQFLTAWDIAGLSNNYAPDREQWAVWVKSSQLVIDELDKVPERNKERMWQFLHERHSKRLKTVCTANQYHMPKWLARRFDITIDCKEQAR